MSIRDILMTDQLMLAAWNMKGKPSKKIENLTHQPFEFDKLF